MGVCRALFDLDERRCAAARSCVARSDHGLRSVVRGGISWRMVPNDLPPGYSIYQQTQRWLKAGVFETLVHDLRALLRLAAGREEQPTGTIFDSRTLNPAWRVVNGRAMMEPNAAKAAKRTWQSIHWYCC